MDRLINIIKSLRRVFTFWIAEYSLDHLKSLRIFEAKKALEILSPYEKRFIEIGGGAGWQRDFFEANGCKCTSYDVDTSNYKAENIDAVMIYDGAILPLSDGSVDVIFSSNTLEHIPHLHDVLRDHARVLSPNGVALHILPSSSWRFWTIISDLVKKFYWTAPHGEFSNNVFTEIVDFSVGSWIARFNAAGFRVESVAPGGIFYTGNALLGKNLSVARRRTVSKIFGSSTNYFLIKYDQNLVAGDN